MAPAIKAGKRVDIAAHGCSIRALPRDVDSFVRAQIARRNDCAPRQRLPASAT
ncbi:hypothetical protein RQP53_18100 [Paucibacter sp. APW11]|uniref:Uncharacterized protein n=1 Tax=Roseateles aquae TaxID=3077235 RepID=A0ABU3PF53_9BURK|nr:hypothetical protein [Paucibacter sp. APW11]MDT9001196.1 hypothetical protein [Paucibacter sp. APW11]